MSIASTMKRARESKKLTQAQLADQLGVATSTVAGWETGAHGIRMHRLAEIAVALDVKLEELIAS